MIVLERHYIHPPHHFFKIFDVLYLWCNKVSFFAFFYIKKTLVKEPVEGRIFFQLIKLVGMSISPNKYKLGSNFSKEVIGNKNYHVNKIQKYSIFELYEVEQVCEQPCSIMEKGFLGAGFIRKTLYNKNKQNFSGIPNLPKCKTEIFGYNLLIYDNQWLPTSATIGKGGKVGIAFSKLRLTQTLWDGKNLKSINAADKEKSLLPSKREKIKYTKGQAKEIKLPTNKVGKRVIVSTTTLMIKRLAEEKREKLNIGKKVGWKENSVGENLTQIFEGGIDFFKRADKALTCPLREESTV